MSPANKTICILCPNTCSKGARQFICDDQDFIQSTLNVKITPTGGPLCIKCDYAIVAFQKLKESLKSKQLPNKPEKKDKLVATNSSASLGDNAELQQKGPESQLSSKRAKTTEYAVDDKVKFFDKRVGANVKAVVTKIVNDDVCMIGVQGSKPFHINCSFLTKYVGE